VRVSMSVKEPAHVSQQHSQKQFMREERKRTEDRMMKRG
jgi:hypothetical protein